MAAVVLAGAVPALAQAQTLGCPVPCAPLPAMGWEGEFRAQPVHLPSLRTRARLAGTVFAPPAGRQRDGGAAVVVLVPGSGGTAREHNYHWSARELAAHGYVVLGVDPQGIGNSATFGDPPCEPQRLLEDPGYPYPCRGVPFQQRPNFDDAALSGVAWALSDANPFASLVDRRRVGVAGHSLGAGAAATAQEADHRIGAIVAWDGLDGDAYAMDTNAPTHHLVNGHVPLDGELRRPLAPRAPALGLHSDHETTSPYDARPQKRLSGWYRWRAAGRPTMVLTLRGLQHTEYGQSEGGPADPAELRRLQHYTRAWFDLHLRDDAGAYDRLLAQDVQGVSRDRVLSDAFRSAIFLPGLGIDCEDLRAQCPDVAPPPSSAAPAGCALRLAAARATRQRVVVRGRACPGRVRVAIARRDGKACRHLLAGGRLGGRRSCSRPVWLATRRSGHAWSSRRRLATRPRERVLLRVHQGSASLRREVRAR